MKRLFIGVLMSILVIMLATACTSTFGSYENHTNSLWTMGYMKFDGEKSVTIHVDKDEPTEIKVDIVSESGKINILIVDEDNNSVYQGKEIPTSKFTVKLEKEGNYTVKVTAEDHKGSFKFNWGK